MRIREITESLRPREKMLKGLYLSDAELLAILLGEGSHGENVIELASRMIYSYGLNGILGMSASELKRIKGIGNAKACSVLAAFELSRRITSNDNMIISNASSVYSYFKERLNGLDKEHFYVILLDTKNRIIKDVLVSVGTLNSALIHPREVFKPAIRESANSIILVHNHPSGDPSPSEEDIIVTKKLIKIGSEIGIKVLDHVIVGKKGYWSFRKNSID